MFDTRAHTKDLGCAQRFDDIISEPGILRHSPSRTTKLTRQLCFCRGSGLLFSLLALVRIQLYMSNGDQSRKKKSLPHAVFRSLHAVASAHPDSTGCPLP